MSAPPYLLALTGAAFAALAFGAALAGGCPFCTDTGSLNGACWIALRTTPFRRQRVQTRAYRVVPLGVVIFTRCRFGLNSRRVMPVIFVPTPPRYFALPRCSTWFPMLGFFSQYSHWAIARSSFCRPDLMLLEA